MQDTLKVVTHDGSFHLDELFSIAVITLLNPQKKIEVVRTRDEAVMVGADWVVDVGGTYDHSDRRYDHHQVDAPVRSNGIPYAAFGLVWRHWGSELCGNEEVANAIDTQFIQMVDGPDNGYETYQSLISDAYVPSINILSLIWQPHWNEQKDYDTAFNELLPLVVEILEKLITFYQSRYAATLKFEKCYKNSSDKTIVVVPKGVSPSNPENYPECKFLIYHETEDDTWKAKCITDGGFKCRISFPEKWRGLRREELAQVTGIKGARFVHKAGFLAVAETLPEIVKMCQTAIEMKSY